MLFSYGKICCIQLLNPVVESTLSQGIVAPETGNISPCSSAYNVIPMKIWWRLEQHCAAAALARARDSAGSSMAAKMPMMAITTSNSINVNALRYKKASWSSDDDDELSHNL